MNILIFCIFGLVPFQNAAVHEAEVTVCPDYADILRFENDLAFPKMLYPMKEAEPLPTAQEAVETTETESVQEENTLPAPVLTKNIPTLEPEIVYEKVLEPKEELKLEAEEIQNPYQAAKPATPTMATERKVMVEDISQTVMSRSETQNDEPIRRPWGALTFCVFILLLSVSVNVFLGWQLLEARNMKLK